MGVLSHMAVDTLSIRFIQSQSNRSKPLHNIELSKKIEINLNYPSHLIMSCVVDGQDFIFFL